jgi:acetyl-CoA carboxylase alpha subunit
MNAEVKEIKRGKSAWQTVQIARHVNRPQFLDYVAGLFTDFDPLHGDRAFGDDQALIGGLARFNGRPVIVVGQHRGRTTSERIKHNFGMTNPEGYRKAMRLFEFYRYDGRVSGRWRGRAWTGGSDCALFSHAVNAENACHCHGDR